MECIYRGYGVPLFYRNTELPQASYLYGSRRQLSERYGFVIPVAAHLHEFAPGSIHDNPNKGLDLKLKQMAQTYFEEHYGTREEFRFIFGKSWL